MRMIVVLTALCIANTALAQAQQDKSLVSAGGATMTDGTTQLSANLGDVISGISMAPGGVAIIEHGFWAGNIEQLLDVHDQPRVTFVEFLGPTAPNPAQTATAIEFGLTKDGQATLLVYDVAGRLVRQLVNGSMHAGVYRMDWDLRSNDGLRVPAGIYFALLSTGAVTMVRRLVVLD